MKSKEGKGKKSVKKLCSKLKLSTKKIPGIYDFIGKLFLTFNERNNTSINTLSQTIVKEYTAPNLFYIASITLITKPDSDITRTENYRPVSPRKLDAKILNKVLTNQTL